MLCVLKRNTWHLFCFPDPPWVQSERQCAWSGFARRPQVSSAGHLMCVYASVAAARKGPERQAILVRAWYTRKGTTQFLA